LAILSVLCLSIVDAHAKKPEVTRHDAQYLDRQVSVSLQWQSSELVVSIRVAAGREVKQLKIDPYDNKKTRSGYTGEVSVVLQADPMMSQDSIPYTIQLEDEDGQKSVLTTGKAAVPTGAAVVQDDHWGKGKLAGQQRGQKDMIDQLRQVAQVLAAPPVILDVAVNNPGGGTVTFKTKATHSVGMREINFRIFDAQGRQVDSQQILATGKLWEGTSKDFTLSPGGYSVIAQAVDASGSTSRESKASFAIAGMATSVQPPYPPVDPPVAQTVTPTVTPPVYPPVTPPVDPPVIPPVIPLVIPLVISPVTPPVTQQGLPSISEPVIYTNGNIAGVQNNPTRETAFTINAAHRVTFIYTYHYFNSGKLPGTIALRHSDGAVYGPWQAEGALGQGGVRNAYWFVRPNVEIKAGSYTVVDSDKATWSQNSGSSGAGFVEIRGVRTGTPPPPPPGPVTPPPLVTLPAGTELVTQPNLRDGLRSWTIQEWMKPSDGKGEVSSDNNYGVMLRGTKENSRIGIMQSLNNLDVSAYGKIFLTAQIRTEEQKLDGTGWQGREAPVGVFVTYTDVNGLVHNGLPIMPSESQTNRMFWEAFYHADPTGNSRNSHGTKVGKGQWYTYQFDLMTLNPRPKVLHYVGAEGAGWPTREGRIALLSLRGQAAPPPPPPPIKELLTGTNLKGLPNWMIQEWMQPSTRRGEVTEDPDGIRFRSESGNTRMGIMQTINTDVSGAQKLILTAVVKAVEQRLDGTGWQGREAPVAIFVTYTDVNGQVRKGLGSMANPPEPQADRMFWHGFYYADPTGNSRDWNGTKVNRGGWYTYEVDLMSLNPKPKTIHAVGAEGSGWSTREGKISLLSLKYYGNASGR
jgi:hypothetical protein